MQLSLTKYYKYVENDIILDATDEFTTFIKGLSLYVVIVIDIVL